MHLMVGLKVRKKLNFPSSFVVSNNPCPEYLLDIMDKKPLALLKQPTLESLADTIKRGPTFFFQMKSILTPAERHVLRPIAEGKSHKEISVTRNIAVTRVRNIVQVIYQKLGLNSGTQLTLYYFGLWHILYRDGWLPPHRYR